jgi:hypothetical protein
MSTSVRSRLLAVLTAVVATAIAIPSSVSPPVPAAAEVSHVDVRMTPRIDLAASVRSLVATPPNPVHVAAATAAIARIDPAASKAAVASQPAIRAAVTKAIAAPQNAASTTIDSIYQSAQNAVTYGVQLASYALQFIPFGYLISDQINIFYYNLGLPIADSVVYGLIDPVVNDPLNPAVYVNGLINVGQTAVNAAVNTAIAEFNNFFGWLIPPLPPLPLAASAPAKPTKPRKAPKKPKTVATTTEQATGSEGAKKSHQRDTTTGSAKTESGTTDKHSEGKHSGDKRQHPAGARA